MDPLEHWTLIPNWPSPPRPLAPGECAAAATNASRWAMTAAAARCEQSRTPFDGCRNVCLVGWMTQVLHHETELEPIIYGYVFPTLVFLVLIANVFVVIVLSKRHMSSPTNLVLLYMAVADMSVGMVPIPFTIFYYTMRNYERLADQQLWWCFTYKYLMDALPPICHNVAMWLTVLLAAQRFVSIHYPVRSRQWLKMRNVKAATAVIVAVSALCGLPKCFEWHLDMFDSWRYSPEVDDWRWYKSCMFSFTRLVQKTGVSTFYNIYFWTRILVFIMLPCVLLIILNILLILGIRSAERRKRRLLSENRGREAQRQMESNSTSIMLVIIVSIFLVVNLPQAVFLALLCVSTTFSLKLAIFQGKFSLFFLLTSNMLIIATYPINFAIYCFMSSAFRETFKGLFCSGPLTSSSAITMRTRTTSRRSDACLDLTGGGGGGGCAYSTVCPSTTDLHPASVSPSERSPASTTRSRAPRKRSERIERGVAGARNGSGATSSKVARDTSMPAELMRLTAVDTHRRAVSPVATSDNSGVAL